MAQQRLNEAQGGPVFGQMGGGDSPQIMRRHGHGQSGAPGMPL